MELTQVTPPWSNLAAEKKERQLKAIPQGWLISVPPDSVLDVTGYPEKCGILTKEEVEITNTPVDVILAKLASGATSSVSVTTAFYKRAIVSQQLVNCLSEIFVEQSLRRAAELDSYLKEHGKVVGPLHGLPVSLKDQLSVKGLETTIGYVGWIGKYAEENAVLVDVLYECGAVPFVRTNVPQTLLWSDSHNHIFGRTTNPYNRSLTPGGSSGGEGALIAMKGSPLGVGSDIGGSIRCPAALCGLYGLRPSFGRLPTSGAVTSVDGPDSLIASFGPMTCSVEGLKIFMEAVIKSKPWMKDPLTVCKHWSENEYKLVNHGNGKDLCFAILWDDEIAIPHPPIQRALEMTRDALIKAGHRAICWAPLKHQQIVDVTQTMLSAGSQDIVSATSLSGEPIITSMQIDSDEPLDAAFRPKASNITAHQLWHAHKLKRDLRIEYLSHWNATVGQTGTSRPVDAIICPVAPYAATPHGKYGYTHYTMVWSTLEYATAVFPVTSVDPILDRKQVRHQFISDFDKEIYEMYDPATFKNAPVGLQLVGRNLEEEAVIAMTEIISTSLKVSKNI
ncbi:amidase signature domain-containing protein [Scleroderma yunnanense]